MALFQISEPGESQIKEACAGRAVGIDLGTTNSLVAAVRDGQPDVLDVDDDGRALLPSVVHYGDAGVIVGREAQALAAAHPQATISSVKRFMGRGPKDAEAQRKHTPYRFAADAEGKSPVVRFDVGGGRQVTPVETSAEILRMLRARAEEQLGGPLDGAVITVPAYFDDAQRQATKDAGRLAGLEVLRLLNEPTAAALAYGLDKGSQGIYAVYDLGGGTFDISILKLIDGVFEVKATGGDSALGGDDFDHAIADRLFAESGDTPDASQVRVALDAARAARERLTTVDTTELVAGELRRTLGRAELEAWIRPIVDKTGGPCRRALKDAGVKPGALDGVILVGGATRTPLVRAFVRELFGKEPLADIDPDKVVAVGAAVQADILAGGRRDDVLLLDVIPLSLGIETMGGVVEKILNRNTTVPAGAAQEFTTFADQQTGFDIHVVQGERDSVENCRSLARFMLKGIPPMAAGMAKVTITFLVDADGILRVSAKEETSGALADVQVKPSYGLTDEEVERMLLESFEHAEEDMKTRLLASERVEAQGILARTRAAMREDAALLDPTVAAEMHTAMAHVDALMAGSDHRALHDAVVALDEAGRPFAEARMDRSIKKAIQGKRVTELER